MIIPFRFENVQKKISGKTIGKVNLVVFDKVNVMGEICSIEFRLIMLVIVDIHDAFL
jgi:hypothetical protein